MTTGQIWHAEQVRRCRAARERAEPLLGPILDELRDLPPLEAWYLSTELLDRIRALDTECETAALDAAEEE